MQKLHTFDLGDIVHLELLKFLLERNGIDYLVKGEHMFSAAGGVPFSECYPEMWIVDERDATSAKNLLAALLRPATGMPPWRCEKCAEWIEGQFDVCWSCETARPAEPSAT
jgi:Putative prokaryotic signal transducing protein